MADNCQCSAGNGWTTLSVSEQDTIGVAANAMNALELWIRKIMGKETVAIFSADRKKVQGKKTNVIGRTFTSKLQQGKINTHVVGPLIGPQNPSGVPQ